MPELRRKKKDCKFEGYIVKSCLKKRKADYMYSKGWLFFTLTKEKTWVSHLFWSSVYTGPIMYYRF
jgi:hypothetical protein